MLNERERAISNAIASQRDQLLQDLTSHIAIPTGGDHQPGLDRYRALLRQRLEAIGARIELKSGNPRPSWLRQPNQPPFDNENLPPILVARHKGYGHGPRILLAGHLDTVHPPEGDFRELTLNSDGLTATGPGAVDMKGGILITIAALEALHATNTDANWTFILTSDEETGSFQSEALLRELAQHHDVGLIMEPALADGSLVIERMGSGQFRIECFGQSAHVGREFTRGVSAVIALGEVLARLGQLSDPANGMIINIGPLQGGTATNVVPDYAAAWGNVRYRDEAAGQRLAERIDQLNSPGESLPRIRIQRHWNRPAKPATDAVRALAKHAQHAARDLGQELPLASTGGVCDGNILQHAGLPCLDTLGVRGGNLHRTDEFIELASLIDRAQLMAILISRLAQIPRN